MCLAANAKNKRSILSRAASTDPTRQGRNRGRALREISKRYSSIDSKLISYLSEALNSAIEASDSIVKVNREYTYNIGEDELANMSEYIGRVIYDELGISRGAPSASNFWLSGYVASSYGEGLRDALRDIKDASAAKYVGREKSIYIRGLELTEITSGPQFRLRVGLVKGRTFELMRGLSDSTRADLADVLGRGVATGKGTKQITEAIVDRIEVSKSRAERIARTEVNTAYRTATRIETNELNAQLFDGEPFQMLMLWFSALAPTTRIDHATRHGKHYTTEQVNDFYARDGNSINCLCSQSPVLVWKETGKLVSETLDEGMEDQRARWRKMQAVK